MTDNFTRADRSQLDRAQRAYDAAVEAALRSDRPWVERELHDAEERLEAAEAALTAVAA